MKNLVYNRQRVKVNKVETVEAPWGYPYAIYEESTPHDKKRYFIEYGEGGEEIDFVIETEDKELAIKKCKEALEATFEEVDG